MDKIENIYLYAKMTDAVADCEAVLQEIHLHQGFGPVRLSIESRRSFHELERIKAAMREHDACIIMNLASLGLNEKEIAKELGWFIERPRMLIIANIDSSYMWGVAQPMNRAVLQTLQQTLTEKGNSRTTMLPEHRKSNAGRKSIAFPDNWEALYGKWVSKEIDSKEFCERSGLKRATFYNLLTEYRQIIEANEKYYSQHCKGWLQFESKAFGQRPQRAL